MEKITGNFIHAKIHRFPERAHVVLTEEILQNDITLPIIEFDLFGR